MSWIKGEPKEMGRYLVTYKTLYSSTNINILWFNPESTYKWYRGSDVEMKPFRWPIKAYMNLPNPA